MWASQDEIERDPELYDCDACPVRQALEGLDAENARAWRVFQQVARRMVMDWHLAPLVLEWAMAEVPEADRLDVLARLAVIYEAMVPPPKTD